MKTTVRKISVALLASLMLLVSAPFVGSASAWHRHRSSTPKDPVIIVAGTFSPAIANEPLAARLRADGYQVFIFELPTLGTQDIYKTAQALNVFSDSVRAQTGAAKVDLIGHSQGGVVGRAYIKWYSGANEVDSMISLGAPHYGTYVANLATFLGLGNCLGITGCEQMSIGSDFVNDLNAGDDTIGNVAYTNFYTKYDELVRPITNATMQDGATNVKIQSQCRWRFVGHIGLILDGTVYSGIQDALAKRSITLNCWAW